MPFAEATAHRRERHGTFAPKQFSRASDHDVVDYRALFQQADSGMSPAGLKVFDVLHTKDFEQVMRTLATVLDVFARGHQAAAR
jgi:hypothetical protein